MRQNITSDHEVDDNGNPAGGRSYGTGIDIRWQNGPLGRGDVRAEPNGAFVEGVIEAALDRMRWYQEAQNGKFKCRQNALVITKLEEALHWCDVGEVVEATELRLQLIDRTREREHRDVEGTHEQ